MAEEWFERLKTEVDHFFATATDEEIRAALAAAQSRLNENACVNIDKKENTMPIVPMTWWDSKGKAHIKEVELTEKDLVNGKITFIEIVSKEHANVRLRKTESGKYHSHLSAGQSPQGWACYIGTVNAAGTMLEGVWRRDDGAYGGEGRFVLPLI